MEMMSFIDSNFLSDLSNPNSPNYEKNWEILSKNYSNIFVKISNTFHIEILEVLDELFILLSRNNFKLIKNFNPDKTSYSEEAFGYYIYKILKNHFLKMKIKENKLLENIKDDFELTKSNLGNSFLSDSISNFYREIEKYLHRLLEDKQIQNIDYYIFGLYFLNYSLKEIAEIIYKDTLRKQDFSKEEKKYIQNVKNKLYRLTREKIRNEFKEYFYQLIEKK